MGLAIEKQRQYKKKNRKESQTTLKNSTNDSNENNLEK